MKYAMAILLILIALLCMLQLKAWGIVPPPPGPPPAAPYSVKVIVEKADDLKQGFKPVATNVVWTSKKQGFYRLVLEIN